MLSAPACRILSPSPPSPARRRHSLSLTSIFPAKLPLQGSTAPFSQQPISTSDRFSLPCSPSLPRLPCDFDQQPRRLLSPPRRTLPSQPPDSLPPISLLPTPSALPLPSRRSFSQSPCIVGILGPLPVSLRRRHRLLSLHLLSVSLTIFGRSLYKSHSFSSSPRTSLSSHYRDPPLTTDAETPLFRSHSSLPPLADIVIPLSSGRRLYAKLPGEAICALHRRLLPLCRLPPQASISQTKLPLPCKTTLFLDEVNSAAMQLIE